jgi:hypothetical protein
LPLAETSQISQEEVINTKEEEEEEEERLYPILYPDIEPTNANIDMNELKKQMSSILVQENILRTKIQACKDMKNSTRLFLIFFLLSLTLTVNKKN